LVNPDQEKAQEKVLVHRKPIGAYFGFSQIEKPNVDKDEEIQRKKGKK